MNWFKHFFNSKPQAVTITVPAYAFCENQAAGSASRWHIRHLTEDGLKLGGGVTTPALCGHLVHWDRKYPINRVAVFLLADSICPKCSAAYLDTRGTQ